MSLYTWAVRRHLSVQQVSPGDKVAQWSTLTHLTLAKLCLDDTETVSSSAIMDRFSMHCKRTKYPFLSLHSFEILNRSAKFNSDPNSIAFSTHGSFFFSQTEKGRERNEDDTKINNLKFKEIIIEPNLNEIYLFLKFCRDVCTEQSE